VSIASLVLKGYGPGGSASEIVLGGYTIGAPPPVAPTLCTRGYGFGGRISSICHAGYSAYHNLPEPPPTGKQYQDIQSIYAGTGDSLEQGAATQPVAIPGAFVVDQVTQRTSYVIHVNPDGTLIIDAGGDTARQILEADIFRAIAGTYDGAFLVFINPSAPVLAQPVQPISNPEGAFLSYDLSLYAQSPDGDALAFSIVGGAPPDGAGIDGQMLDGFTPTIQTGSVTIRATDLAGLTLDFAVPYTIFDTATKTVPNLLAQSVSASTAEILAAGLTVGVAINPDFNGSIPAGFVIAQNPPAGSLVAAGTPVSWQLSLGTSGAVLYSFGGVVRAQIAQVGGGIDFELVPRPVIPAPRVTARSVQWQDIVRMVEGPDYQQRRWYPVYTFGGGAVRRTFVQPV
jgi:hypothetical protein